MLAGDRKRASDSTIANKSRREIYSTFFAGKCEQEAGDFGVIITELSTQDALSTSGGSVRKKI